MTAEIPGRTAADPPQVLKPREAAAYIGQPVSTLAYWRYLDRGDNGGRSPKWIKSANGRTQKCIGYRRAALDEWLAARETA